MHNSFFSFTWFQMIAAVTAVALALVIGAHIQSSKLAAEEHRAIISAQEQIHLLSKRPQGLIAVVTGANSGIGFYLARTLAQQGAHVILACRNPKRGQDAMNSILSEVPHARITLQVLDVTDPVSIKKTAAELNQKLNRIDLLFLNAGIMPVARNRWEIAIEAFFKFTLPFFFETGRATATGSHFLPAPLWGHQRSAAGAPLMFATHLLGHAMLVREVVPLLKAGRGAHDTAGRVIWTGSRAASRNSVNWAAITRETNTKTASIAHQEAYGEAKYATDLYNVALDQFLQQTSDTSRQMRSVVICPGFVDTDMTPAFLRLVTPILRSFRAYMPGFNVDASIGTAVHLMVSTAPNKKLAGDRKFVFLNAQLQQAINGAEQCDAEEVKQIHRIVDDWLLHWDTHVKAQSM